MSAVSTNAHPVRALHSSTVYGMMDVSASEAGSSNAQQSNSVVSSLGWHSSRQSAMNGSAVRSTTWRDVSSTSASHPPPSPLRTPVWAEPFATAAAAFDVTHTGEQAVPSQSSTDRPAVTADTLTSPLFDVEGVVVGFQEFVAHLPPRRTLVPQPSSSTTTVGESESVPPSLDDRPVLDTTKRPTASPTSSLTQPPPPTHPTSPPAASSGSAPPSVLEPPRLPSQLPPSSVPAHRIRSPSRVEYAGGGSTAASAGAASQTTTARKGSAPFAASGSRHTAPAGEAPTAAPSQRSGVTSADSGFVIMATRRRETETLPAGAVGGAVGGGGGGGGKAERDRRRTNVPSALGAVSGPASPTSSRGFPANPLTRSMTPTLMDGDSLDSGGALNPREAFYRYVDDTRHTVLSPTVSAAERAEALDGLLTRSCELFELLDSVRTTLGDSTERRRYPMLKVVPYEGVSGSSTTMISVHSRMVAQQNDSILPSDDAITTTLTTLTTATGDDGMPHPVLEPLSLTTRTYATQLPPLGPAAALRLLGCIERGRRSSLNSCSSASVAYIDVVNHYGVIRLLGMGATGRVYLAFDRHSGTYYAMKTVPRHSRRSNQRQFPLRRPSSFSDNSIMEGAGSLAVPIVETPSKLPPRYTTPASITATAAAATAAGGAVPVSVVSADGTSPGSITRTTCFPDSAVSAAKQLAEGKTAAATAAQPFQGLREGDMDHLAQSASHASGIVIPYVESLGTIESSSVSARDAQPRDGGMEALLMEDLLARPSPLRVSSSFTRRPGEAARTAGPTTRPPMAPSTARAAASSSASRREHSPSSQPAPPTEADLSAVEREIRVLRRVQNHSNVVQLKEVVDDDEEDCAHLIMTYAANGPLTMMHGFDPAQGCVSANVVRPFPRCSRLLRQLAEALMYVHRQRIVHNDVKPDNILLTASDDVLLTDFGESVLIPKRVQSAASQGPQAPNSPRGENLNATVMVPHNRWKARGGGGDSVLGGPSGDLYEQSASCRLPAHGGMSMGGTMAGASQLMIPEVSFHPDSSMFLAVGVDHDGRLNGDRVVVGSPAFAAPELIGNSVCSYKSDTWSFGVVMYTIVFGRLPFAGASISETFEDILHKPLTFPPLEAVPHGEELTPATYEQWVLLCSKLLVREPQQRLSLSAVLRHPLLRAASAAATGSVNALGGDALSVSKRSASTRQAQPESAGGQRRSAHHRRSSTARLEGSQEDAQPISRTTRAKSINGALPSPWSVVPEQLLRSESPRGLSSAASGSTGSSNRASCEASAQSSRGALQTPSPPTPPPPPPPLHGNGAGQTPNVPTPPALPCEKAPTQPPSRLTHAVSKPDDDSTTTLATAANQNSTTLLPSLPPPPSLSSKGTETLPPSCTSNNEDGANALPSPPAHLQEKTLAYYQGSELGSSARTVSPTEASLFSVTNRAFHDYRRSPLPHSPIGTALLMTDCAVVLPTVMKPDASTNGATASLSHPSEREEVRRLGPGVRDGRLRSRSGSEEQFAGAASVPVGAAAVPAAAAAGAAPVRAASSATSDPLNCANTLPLQSSYTHGDLAENTATKRSISGITCKPSAEGFGGHGDGGGSGGGSVGDGSGAGSSSTMTDALSQQESALDYYSYWNESEGDAELGSSSSEEAEEEEAPATAAATKAGDILVAPLRSLSARAKIPHTPHGSRVSAVSPRPSLVTPPPTATLPVLSNQEEVPGRGEGKTKGSVVRSKRQRGSTSLAGDARLSSRRPSRLWPAPSDAETVATTPERSRRGSAARRGSSVSGGSKTTAPPPPPVRGERGSVVASGGRETQREDASLKQPPTSPSRSRSWFRRRH